MCNVMMHGTIVIAIVLIPCVVITDSGVNNINLPVNSKDLIYVGRCENKIKYYIIMDININC